MLKKLIKYDLKWVNKVLIIYYIASLFFAITYRILNVGDTSSVAMGVIIGICQGFAIAMMASALINCIMRSWVRFSKNLYGDESYLTHTLPVKKSTMFYSKLWSTVVSMFISIFIIAASLMIMYYSDSTVLWLKSMDETFNVIFGNSIWSFVILVSVVFFLEMLFIVSCGFLGMVIGNKANSMKRGLSILFGFIIFLATQTVTLGILFVTGLVNPDIMQVFTSSSITSYNVLSTIMIIVDIIYIVYVAVCSVVGAKLFKQGVNID